MKLTTDKTEKRILSVVFLLCRYARQGTVVFARAGICRATDSDRLCLDLTAVSQDREGFFPIRL